MTESEHDAGRGRPGDSGEPSARTLAVCFLRAYLVGATFNRRGLQNIGLFYAIDPGLVAIHGEGPGLKKARRRYLKHFNSHPLWAPLLTALFLSMEMKIAKGQLPGEMLEKVKNTTAYTLSAVGDSLFGGSVVAFWSLSLAVLVVNGWPWAALLTGAVWVVLLQAFKLGCFLAGLREGFAVLQRFKRWNLINWSVRIKLANAALLAVFWGSIRPAGTPMAWWLGAAGALAGLAHASVRLGISREIIALAVLAFYILAPGIVKLVPAMF